MTANTQTPANCPLCGIEVQVVVSFRQTSMRNADPRTVQLEAYPDLTRLWEHLDLKHPAGAPVPVPGGTSTSGTSSSATVGVNLGLGQQ